MNKTLILTLAAALVAPFALATHTPQGRCDSDGTPALGIVEISGGSADTTFYVDDRNYALANGIWIYMESNGIWTGTDPAHDLTRGGASPFVPDDPEICTDDPLVLPDTLIL